MVFLNLIYEFWKWYWPQEKTTTRTHEGKTFVPILCHLLTKTGHIRGNVAIAKSFYNIDIVILICCSFTLFTHVAWLLIIGPLVRVRLVEPVSVRLKLFWIVFQIGPSVHIGVHHSGSWSSSLTAYFFCPILEIDSFRGEWADRLVPPFQRAI